MSFTTPIGWIALAALGAVVVLHMYRRRLAERRVAALFLWAPDAMEAHAGRRRTRLLRSPSLWLELAAALLATLALAGLDLGAGGPASHLVIVLDDSASMSARTLGGPVAERAKRRLEELAAEMPRGAVVTLVRSGRRPTLALGPRAPLGMLGAALDAYRPSQPGHDLDAALELAASLRAGEADRLVLVTDRTDVAAPAAFEVHAVGEAAENVALASARRVRDGAREHVLVDLLALADRTLEREVVVELEGRAEPIARRRVSCRPDHPARLHVTLPAGDRALRVRVAPDALTLDDEAVLLPAPRPVVRLASLLSREAATALRWSRALHSLPDVEVSTDPTRAQVLLSPAPGRLRPSTTEIVIAPLGEERDTWIGPYAIQRRHPLCRGLTLDGVVWTAGRADPPGLPLAAAGERTLIAEEDHGEAVRIWLNLAPEATNFAASPDWPILLANVVERARARAPGPREVNVPLGETIEYRFAGRPQDAAKVALEDPDGARRPARGLRLLAWEARLPGVHRLMQGERELARYAVHFVDPQESDLRACSSGIRRAEPPAGEHTTRVAAVRPGRVEFLVLALLFLALVVADWIVLRRRRS